MKLIFKKAFGFQLLPANAMFWRMELGGTTYTFRVGKTPVEICGGWFGRTTQENHAIDRFLPSSHRPFQGEIPTLDVAFDVEAEVPETWLARAGEWGVADEVVALHIDTAFRAVRRFTESYRDCKYAMYRGTDRWNRGQTFVPRITEQDFRTFLFYVLAWESHHTFVGAFSEGKSLMGEPTGGEFSVGLQGTLQRQIPLDRQFIQIAWERFLDEDLSGAVIYAAISVEKALARLLTERLTSLRAGTGTEIKRLIRETSNRLLCTVILGALGIGDPNLRRRLKEVFNVRNELAHGIKAAVRRSDAESAIRAAELFLTIADAEQPAGDQNAFPAGRQEAPE